MLKFTVQRYLRSVAFLGLIAALSASAPAIAQEEETAFDAGSIGSLAGAFLAARTADYDRDTQAAIRFYERAVSLDPENNELKQRLMIAYLTDGQFERGMALARDLQDVAEVERVTSLVKAVDAMRKREYRAAEEALNADTMNELDALIAGLMRAWARLGQDEPEEAIALIDNMQGPPSFTIFLNFHSGAIAAAAGDRVEARSRLTAAVTDQAGGQAAPDTFMRAVMTLARLEARAGDQRAALDALSVGENFSPGYAPLAALRQSIEAGEKPKVDISSAQDGGAAVLETVAAALNRQGAEEVVALYLHLSRVLDPENADTLVMLGELAENLQQPERAIDIYRSVPEESPMWRVAQLRLGLNLADMDRTEEAKEHLLALIEADPSDMNSYIAYGSVLSAAEQYEEMAANYDRAVDAITGTPDRSHWNIFFQRGIAYERLKEWETAEPNFERALALFPEQPQVLNYLGYSWIDMNMNLEEGMDMIERAVEQRPNDGYIVDSLGWAHYRLGNFEEAVSELERAVELSPSDPTINDHLGDAYWRVGRRLEAVFQWNRALTLDPPEDQIADINEKIEDGLPEPSPAATAEERDGQRPEAASPDDRTDVDVDRGFDFAFRSNWRLDDA